MHPPSLPKYSTEALRREVHNRPSTVPTPPIVPLKAALLAYDDCALHSLSRVSGLLLLANRANEEYGNPHPAYVGQVVAPGGNTVVSGPGVRVLADDGLNDERFDIVFISAFYNLGPARLEALLRRSTPICTWLARQWSAGALLVALGSGSLLLAEAGLLEKRSATTIHWLRGFVRSRYPGVVWQDSTLSTEDHRLLCGSAISSDLPLLQRAISQTMSPRIASRCAQLVLEQAGLSSDSPQLTTYLDVFQRDPVLAKVDQWVSKNLGRKPTLEKLSRSVGVSPRTLHRLLRRELAVSPAEYVLQRRIETACRLLEETRKSIDEISRRVGYSDASVFGRAFRSRVGITPGAYRTRHLKTVIHTF